MKFGRFGWSYFFLRIGLGVMFVMVSLSIFRNAEEWLQYLPQTVPGGLTPEAALMLVAAFDLGLGLMLLFGYWPRLTGWLLVAHFTTILFINRPDRMIVHDIGLLGAALALAMWPQHQGSWWKPRIFRKRKPRFDDEE